MPDVLTGTLSFFSGKDSDVMLWLFIKDDAESLESVRLIKEGDWLTIFTEEGGVLFNEMVECDLSEEKRRAIGFRVCWTQKGWEPDDWARLFIRGKEKPFRAELRKRTLH